MKNALRIVMASVVATTFAACGGGGGGGGGGSAPVIYYPYETVFKEVCTSSTEPTPGCTFDRKTGLRINVEKDPHYNRNGHTSDDMWFVEFDANGQAAIYDNYGNLQRYADISEFKGYIPGTSSIGVGNYGTYWEDVTLGTYWLGKNGVLYSANDQEANWGQAINDKTSSSASDANFAALNSDSNKKLVARASEKLMKEYGFQKDKAVAVASALNSWAVAAAERGKTTEKDMDKTFKAVFGVQFGDALAAVKDLQMGDNGSMRDLTNRSASALGLKPNQAQKFMKGMYKKALADWGYDESSFNW